MATTTESLPDHQTPEVVELTPAQAQELHELETGSQQLWHRFTRFLAGNVVACAIGLIFVGLLTVWR